MTKIYMDENKKEEMNTTPESSEVTGGEAQTDMSTSEATEVPSGATAQESPNSSNMWIAIVVIFGAIFIAGMTWYLNTGTPNADDTAVVVRDADYVLATVNGEEIYQKDLDARLAESAQQIAAQGVDLNDATVRAEVESQLLNDIIGYKLLVAASVAAGIEVSAEEVDVVLAGYLEQFGSEEALESELEKVGLTQDSFRERIIEQQQVQQYIVANTQQVEVSDEDIVAFYDSAVAGQEGAPALEEVREQIVTQLSAGAQQQEVLALVASLREAAEVEVK